MKRNNLISVISISFLICIFITAALDAKEIRYRINAAELTQLNQFYQQCGGLNWKKNTGWPLPEGEQTTPPSADGLSFKYTTIQDDDNLQLIELSCQYIYLQDNQLNGSIPNFNLPNLTSLILFNNQLSGSIPNFNLPNLVDLYLSDNQLSGSIPNFNLPNLEQLSLSYNQLNGSIPNFNLPNLSQLELVNNQLSGSIPNFNMPNLEYLSLTKNQLSGSIPNFNLPNLTGLGLNNNQLNGSIPNFNLPNLTGLDLNNNSLTGSIPNFNLPNLTWLGLNNNSLSGSIPNFNMPKLTWLYLDNNQLSGSIPNFNMPKLVELSLGSNQLSGSIPNFNMPNLQSLYLNYNKLTFNELNNYSEFVRLGANFPYSPQDTILVLDFNSSTRELSVLTEGANNQYKWLRGTQEYKTTSENHITLPEGEKSEWYACEVSNTVLTALTLKTRAAEEPQLSSKISGKATMPWLNQNIKLSYRPISGLALSIPSLGLSTTTQSDGSFEFESDKIESGKQYSIQTSYTANGNTIEYKDELAESGKSVDIIMPNELMEYISQKGTELNSVEYDYSAFLTVGSNSSIDPGDYDLSFINTAVSRHTSITRNSAEPQRPENIANSLASLAVSMNANTVLTKCASKAATETGENITGIVSIFLGMLDFVKEANKVFGESAALRKINVKLTNLILDIGTQFAGAAKLGSEELRDELSELVSTIKTIANASLDFFSTSLEESAKLIIHPATSRLMLTPYIVGNGVLLTSQYNLNRAALNAIQAQSLKMNIDEYATSAYHKVADKKARTENNALLCATLRNASDYTAILADVEAYRKSINKMSLLKCLGKSAELYLKIASSVFLATSTGISIYDFYAVNSTYNEITTDQFNKVRGNDNLIMSNYSFAEDYQNIKTDIELFNTTALGISTKISSNNTDNIKYEIATLDSLDFILSENMTKISTKISSGTSIAINSDSSYSQVFENNTYHISNSGYKRMSLLLDYYYSADTLDTEHRAKIQSKCDTVIASNLRMLQGLDSLIAPIKNIELPAVVRIEHLNVPETVKKDSSFIVKIKYSNLSNTDITNAVLKIDTLNKVVLSRDTVLIPLIKANSSGELEITASSNGQDSTIGIIVSFKNKEFGCNWQSESVKIQANTSSVDDFNSEFSISPQPVRGEAVVTYNVENANAGISIELYDLKGTIVATYTFTSLSEGTNKLRLDVSNIPSGMYNAVIKNGAAVRTAKLIKVD